MIERQDITDGMLRKRWSLKEFEEFHRGVKPARTKSLLVSPLGKVFLEELVPIMVWLQQLGAKPNCSFQLKQTAELEEGWDARIEMDGNLLQVQITTIGPAWQDSEGRVKYGEAYKAMLKELQRTNWSEGCGPIRIKNVGRDSGADMQPTSEVQNAYLCSLVDVLKKKSRSSDRNIILLIYMIEDAEWLDDAMLDEVINQASRAVSWPQYKALFVFGKNLFRHLT